MRRSPVEGLNPREGGGSDGKRKRKSESLLESATQLDVREALLTITAWYLWWRCRESSPGVVQPSFGFLETLFKVSDLIFDCLRLRRVGCVTAHRGSMVHRSVKLWSVGFWYRPL